MKIRNIKKPAHSAIIISVAFGLLAVTHSQQAAAAAAAPSPAAPSNAGPAPSAGEYRPSYKFISPDGHVVGAFEAIRSPEFCTPLFNQGKAKSNHEQSRFWTQCILGGPINR